MDRKVKRLLLLNPPSGLYRRDDRCQSRVEEQTVQVIFPPIDLAYLGAVAEREGAEVKIADYPATGGGWEEFILDITSFKPELLIIDVTTATLERDLLACRIAKEINPEIITSAKGEYLSLYGKKVLEVSPELDMVFLGEAEETLAEIIRKGVDDSVRGIFVRDGGEILTPGERELLRDLDTLPFPARHLLDNSLYRSPETGNPLTVIHAQRGCPARCIFCPAGKLSGYRLRLRSPENVVAEIRECVEKFGIREFLLHGDTFTMKKSWVIELCKLIVEEGLEIRWGCNSRVDTFDRERAEWLKKAGCWVVAFGVESGSQELLERMKKDCTVEQAREAVKICREVGLSPHLFFVIGLPWETRKTLEETYNLIKELDPDFFDINIAYPLPGTEFFDIVIRDGLLVSEDALVWGSYGKSAVRTYELEAEELTRWRRSALLKLYLRPGYILRTLGRSMNSPRVMKNYLRSAWRRFRYLISI